MGSAPAAHPVSAQPVKLFERNAQLAKNLKEKRRADFPTSVKGNRDGATVGVVSSFVTA